MQLPILPPFLLAFILFISLQISSYSSTAQPLEEPQPELAMELKIVSRPIQYGSNSLYVTDANSIALQTGIRYDMPKKISANRHIDFVGQAGFLFCKAKVFDTTFFDTGTNRYQRQHSRNPAYLPVYVGVYNMAAFSVGAELFFWKGLGTRDIWGVKFLSLGVNAKQFRLMAAGEWYAQVKNGRNSGLCVSVSFYWKLISEWYRDKKAGNK